MGLVLGLICIVAALAVGFGITALAYRNVKEFREDQYENFITTRYLAKK